MATVFFFISQTEVFRTGTSSDDDGLGLNLVASFVFEVERTAAEVSLHDGTVTEICTVKCSLLAHFVHQLVGINSFVEAREILDEGCSSQLSTRLQSGVEHRSEVGASGIDGCGIACRAAADYQSLGFLHSIYDLHLSFE